MSNNDIAKNAFAYRLTRLRGNWAVTYNDATTGKRHRHSLKTASRHEAEKQAPSVYEQLIRPKNPGEGVIDMLVEAYNKDKAGRVIVKDTLYRWKRLQRYFGGRKATTIALADSRAYVALRRKEGVKDGTIHSELLNLRIILNWAVKHGFISTAPYIELPPASPPRTRYLTFDEVQQLLKHSHAPHLRLAIILMLATAARISALLELTWDRVDLTNKQIHLHNPEDKSRRKGRAVIPINNSLNEALSEAFHVAQTPYVIEWHGRPIKHLWDGVNAAAQRANIKNVSPHVFRHTAAVWMAEAGISMSEISQYLGHSNTSITERVYARYSPDYLRKAAAALEITLKT